MANLMNLDIRNGFCIVRSDVDNIVIQLLVMEIQGSSSSVASAEGPTYLSRLRKR